MLYTLIGKKVGMTQVYDEGNALVPVTVIEAGPCAVTQVKRAKKDGYNAVQIGFGKRKLNRLRKSEAGHFNKSGAQPSTHVREVRCAGEPEFQPGELLTVSGFNAGDKVDVVGTSKGQGFQGVVKRHGFSGGYRTHGSMMHRRGGAYGQCQWPGEVYKGRKMPGHMGNIRRTVQNLRVIRVMEDRNLILVRGSIPGANGAPVLVRSAKKQRKSA